MKKFLITGMLMILCACATTSQIPEWQETSFRDIENYKTSFLTGKEGIAEAHFNRARGALATSNDLDLLAKAYLTKYALHASVLEEFDESEFLRIDRLQSVAANLSYYNFLKGNFAAVDESLLPDQYSKIIKSAREKNVAEARKEITAIDDPVSRLVACGVWIKHLSGDETILQTAINTAAENGWQKPLWAYLSQLEKYYLERGEIAKAAGIKERLELLKK
ncbi:MAG: hypothetical protein JW914_03440 [Syntrophaceae bacterium]|nr:hypothetical protein [Syntrophaceae bacterium]